MRIYIVSLIVFLTTNCAQIIGLNEGIPKPDEAGNKCAESGLLTCSKTLDEIHLICDNNLIWEAEECNQNWICDRDGTSDTYGKCIRK